jgi:hypothetical protein
MLKILLLVSFVASCIPLGSEVDLDKWQVMLSNSEGEIQEEEESEELVA